MRYILRRREIVTDEWHHLGEHVPQGRPLTVPLAQLRQDPLQWRQWPGALGVRMAPDAAPEDLRDDLPGLDLVAVEFPNPGDGRGYSLGRLLRERLGFRGELRAVGAGVRQDQVFLMSRCGFAGRRPRGGAPGVATLRRRLPTRRLGCRRCCDHQGAAFLCLVLAAASSGRPRRQCGHRPEQLAGLRFVQCTSAAVTTLVHRPKSQEADFGGQ